ncbi:hypothetical protein Scep_014023 [Stephania cephalantha]|uniref:BZIP domain-containing protein n=1 Tax=Stephania cephalantha TaxID=152367 RepID=A0AAP0J2H6_9MAGN
MTIMNDGEGEILEQVLLSNHTDVSSEFQGSGSSDSFLDQFLRNTQTCMHTHTCNPPGPDAAVHTHTCYHTHTHVFTSEEDDGRSEKQHLCLKSRRPSGNREAVRKYREKKKAHAAYLEEEVKKLRSLNQQLIRKLQGHAMFETEVLRLRSILIDLRGKIDNELGVFPFHKQCVSTTSFEEENSRIQSIGESAGPRCETVVPCLHPRSVSSPQNGIGGSMAISWDGRCEPAIAACQATENGGSEQDLASAKTNLNGLMSKSMDTDGTLAKSACQTV